MLLKSSIPLRKLHNTCKKYSLSRSLIYFYSEESSHTIVFLFFHFDFVYYHYHYSGLCKQTRITVQKTQTRHSCQAFVRAASTSLAVAVTMKKPPVCFSCRQDIAVEERVRVEIGVCAPWTNFVNVPPQCRVQIQNKISK